MSTPAASRNGSIALSGDANGEDAAQARRGNALSNRLTSVLSFSYADTDIRNALRLYDARYGNKEIDEDFDLKYEAQKEVIEANARIVDDFSKVAQQLNSVGTLIDTLNQTCDDIRKHVLAAKQETAPMLEEASTLLAQRQETQAKQELLESFCKHFLISDEDLTTLTSSAELVNERFFEVLGRVKQIHKDCELLLGYNNQRLGLELMEQTTNNLNAGYKKLFNSTLREFKRLDLEDPHISGSIRRSLRALSERPALFQNCLDSFAEARQTTVSDAFQKALTDSTTGAARAIDFSSHDPLRYMGDMLAWVHSATVSEMEALEGLFISDEDEINRGLHQGKTADPFFMKGTGHEGEDQDHPFDGHAALNSLISRNMATVSHTLTQRISITTRNLSTPVEIYKAYNLLSFYHGMFLKLIRHSSSRTPQATSSASEEESNTLLSTLTNLLSQTYHHFETTVLETLHVSLTDETPDPSLAPPEALIETLRSFTAITQTRGPNLDRAEFTKLYQTLLTPILDACDDLASQASELPGATSASTHIYRLNYMSLVHDTLSSLATGTGTGPAKIKIVVASEPLKSVEAQLARTTPQLSGLLERTFREASRLNELLELIDETRNAHSSAIRQRKSLLRRTVGSDDSQSTGGQADLKLEVLAQRLDTFLASALMDAQDDLGKLIDKGIAKEVLGSAVSSFIEAFEVQVRALEEIDEAVERERLGRGMGKGKEVNGTDGDREEEDCEEEGEKDEVRLRDVYPRTVEEVEALLS